MDGIGGIGSSSLFLVDSPGKQERSRELIDITWEDIELPHGGILSTENGWSTFVDGCEGGSWGFAISPNHFATKHEKEWGLKILRNYLNENGVPAELQDTYPTTADFLKAAEDHFSKEKHHPELMSNILDTKKFVIRTAAHIKEHSLHEPAEAGDSVSANHDGRAPKLIETAASAYALEEAMREEKRVPNAQHLAALLSKSRE